MSRGSTHLNRRGGEPNGRTPRAPNGRPLGYSLAGVCWIGQSADSTSGESYDAGLAAILNKGGIDNEALEAIGCLDDKAPRRHLYRHRVEPGLKPSTTCPLIESPGRRGERHLVGDRQNPDYTSMPCFASKSPSASAKLFSGQFRVENPYPCWPFRRS